MFVTINCLWVRSWILLQCNLGLAVGLIGYNECDNSKSKESNIQSNDIGCGNKMPLEKASRSVPELTKHISGLMRPKHSPVILTQVWLMELQTRFQLNWLGSHFKFQLKRVTAMLSNELATFRAINIIYFCLISDMHLRLCKLWVIVGWVRRPRLV